MCTIINKSLHTGDVPRGMKIAKVTPIYKYKDKTDIRNYSPLFLLPSLSKILEKLFPERLYSLWKQDTLFENQCGFRPKHSTIDEVAKITFHVMTSIENKHTTIAMLLDLSKAFDTIYHQILLNKLDHYGIWGIALDWFINYP